MLENISIKNQTILISPLDWGLGHATRIVPIIKHLQRNNKIIIATSGNPENFLKKEFPQIQFVKLESVKVKYPKRGNLMPLKMFFSAHRFFFGIFKEHKSLKKLIKKYDISFIISDNRFGLWNKNVFSIFITHQIFIKTPTALKFFEYPILLLNKFFISKFQELWIPDNEGVNNFSGDLSHKYKIHKNTKFIGTLSRFSKKEMVKIDKNQEKYDIIAIISGPEPQKTIFKNIVLEKLLNSEKKSLVLLGEPKNIFVKRLNNVKIINHLETNDLEKAIINSDLIISRAGYSTIMDLATINKKAILIPTPGQTEQEYLSKHLKNNSNFKFYTQKHFHKNIFF